MTLEAPLRFLFLSALWVVLIHSADGDFLKSERDTTGKQETASFLDNPSSTLVKLLRAWNLSKQQPRATLRHSHLPCAPSPICPEGFGLYRTNRQDIEGCFQYQCIHPLPTNRNHDPQLPNRNPNCSPPSCPPGFKPVATTVQTPVGCPEYVCRPLPKPVRPRRWRTCIMTGSVIETVESHVINCFDACNITMLKNKDKTFTVKVLKICKEKLCNRSVEIYVRHRSFKGAHYTIILNPDLYIDITDGTKSWRYTPQRAFLISKRCPFKVAYSGDTIIFSIPVLRFTVIWDSNMDARFQYLVQICGKLIGVCSIAGGMGPYGENPGQVASTGAEHLHSWKCGTCHKLRCSKKNEIKAWKICELVREEPFSRCKSVMDTCNYPARCKDTVCSCLESCTDARKCKCQALTKFTKECLLLKPDLMSLLQDGLHAHKCVPKCPLGKAFHLCYHQACQRKCEIIDSEPCSEIKKVCISGCKCPENMVDKAGRCVLRTRCRNCVCFGSSDGTLKTFDNQHFKYKVGCTLVASRDEDNNMLLYVKTTPCICNKTTTCGLALTVKAMSGYVFVVHMSTDFLGQTVVTKNSKRIKLPYRDRLVSIIPIINGAQLLVKEIQLLATVESDTIKKDLFHYKLRVPSELYGDNVNPLEGLCGVCGGSSGRLKTRDNGLTKNILKYAQSWLGAHVSSELLKEVKETGCIGEVVSACGVVDRKDEHICEKIFDLKACVFDHCIKDPWPYFKKCKSLICTEESLFDKKTLACRIWQEYAAVCCEETHRMGDWRKVAGCPIVKCHCKKKYSPCGPGCDATCLHPKCSSSIEWKEGCYCPPGMFQGSKGCIRPSQCKICLGHAVGETWKDFQSCEECKCDVSRRVICKKMCPGPCAKCPWDKVLKGTKKSGGCCFKCVCIKPCPPPKQERKCIKGEILRTSLTDCGCEVKYCYCEPLLCRPKPTCNGFQSLSTYKVTGDCCEYYRCECLGASCCPILIQPECTDEQKLEKKYDDGKCCVTGYQCICLPCHKNPRKPVCRKDQKLVCMTTPCGCVKYECHCKECPPEPVCGIYATLETYNKRKCCCPVYYCRCRKQACPSVQPHFTKCIDDQIISSVFDPSRCCIIRYKCECPKRCKVPKKPFCGPNEKLIAEQTVCNCRRYKCVCDISKCLPIPTCGEYQILKDVIISVFPKPCCRKCACECVDHTKCPKIPSPRCKGEKIPKDVFDPTGCCVVAKKCVCPDVCDIKPYPTCKENEIMVTNITECNCKYRCCVCDKDKCPVVRCGKYEDLKTIKTDGCCDKQFCQCNYDKCGHIKADSKLCTDEEKLFPLFDPAKCCVIGYKCECQPCKEQPKKECGPFEKLITKRSKCNCPHFSCKCDPKKCRAPPRCGRFCDLVSHYKNPKDCCETHECICDPRRCPQIDPRDTVCPVGKVQKAVLDVTKCCVIAYKCECLPCVRPNPKFCEPGERLKVKKDDCGCYRPICLCNGTTTCPKKPKCSKYQYLKTTSNSEDCCMIYTCVCKGLSHCPRVKFPEPCEEDEVMKEIYDPNDCCIVCRTCECDKCKPPPQLVCGPYERTVNKPSKCCNHYTCECDSSKCPVKQCPPCHKLNVYYVKGRCCPKQTCECEVASCPDPSINKPVCKDEEEYVVVYDAAGCCPREVCKCPPNCCKASKVICGPFEKLVSRKTACGCTILHCECDINKCKYPAPCSKYQKMVKTEAPGECCPKFFCVCNPLCCPKIGPSPENCTDEEWLKPISDPDNCCIIDYTCVCNPCPRPIRPVCKPCQKVIIRKSKCGCEKPCCVCDGSIPCEPAPVCSIYQELVESDRSNICCKRYDCICRGTSFCPKVICPVCRDEEKVVDIIDKGKCCIIKKICKCPTRCPNYPRPICKEGERIKIIKTRCCTKCICICDKSLCPPVRCGRYQEKTVIPVKGKCCDCITCHCAIHKCPINIRTPKCKGDQTLHPVRDISGCCVVKYECTCEKCPPYQPKLCRKDQRVVLHQTACGCNYPECECDYTKCPKKKTCGQFQCLKVKKRKCSCCSIYTCVCDRRLCKRTKPNPNQCKDEQILVPVHDCNYCCIIDWKCECQPCPVCPVKDPICSKGEVVLRVKSVCGCPKPICICMSHTCPPRPKCCKDEKLVPSGNDTDCCVGYKCVCISLEECPAVLTPKCVDEEVIVERRGKCCVENKTCVCPPTCPPTPKIKCANCHKLVRKPTKCCWKHVCECDPTQCPVLHCPPAHVLFKTNIAGKCCPKQECVCKPSLCPKISPQQILCKGDQVLKTVKDDAGCCVSYHCVCCKCKIPEKIVCGKYERVVEKKTICGCRKYECCCDLNKCKKPPTCGKFAHLKTFTRIGDCCPTYRCECKCSIEKWKDCHHGLHKPVCKDEQALTPIYDKKACCIKKWCCVCGPCPIRKRAICDKDQKEIIVKSICNCDIPKCVCADSAECNCKPDCSRYQNLIILRTSTRCCRRYECVCKGISQCPVIQPPCCKDEEQLQEITDVADCCVVKKVCVCPDECPKVVIPKCGKCERLVSEPTKCCIRYRCECDISQCPRKVCGPCMILQPSNHIHGECCPRDICVCNPACCRPVPPACCTDEQTPVAVFDADNCCIIKYECKCCKCVIKPKPICGPCERLVTKTSICNCKSYKCECDIRTCPKPPRCSKFQILEVINVIGQCCPRYQCTCKKFLCPKVHCNEVCKEDQVLKPILSPCKCCIIGYKCVCCKCKFRKTPACCQNEIVVRKKTVCGCETYECKCDENACQPIPECSKYQVLRTYNSTTCCQTHVCECIRLQHCPVLRPVRCHEEEELVSIRDRHECCIIKQICICPRTCRPPREPICKPTERVISVPTQCCNKLVCICDKAKCPSPPCCEKYEKLIKIEVLGECCPRYTCKKPEGCVIIDKLTGETILKEENETWSKSPCVSCKCEKCAGSYDIVCQYKTCPICKPGYRHREIPGECCGICEQTHCIQRCKGRRLINVGGRWRDKCNLYECTRKNNTVMIEVTRAECKPVPFCHENEIQQEDECKCPTCKYEKCDTPVIINPRLTVGLVKIDQGNGFICQNTKEIQGLTQCVGNCKSGPRSTAEKFMETTTTYCRSKETKTIKVPLVCPDGKQWLQNVKIPTSCECRKICDCDDLDK